MPRTELTTSAAAVDGASGLPALTVRQPWAFSIFHGKTIENRTQNFRHRGPLAIHAGRTLCPRGSTDRRVIDTLIEHSPGIRTNAADLMRNQGLNHYDIGSAEYGAIIGIVDLVDVHPDTGRCCRPWGESAPDAISRQVHHLVLDNPVALPMPYPCRGALGLWPTPTDLLDHLPEGLDLR